MIPFYSLSLIDFIARAGGGGSSGGGGGGFSGGGGSSSGGSSGGGIFVAIAAVGFVPMYALGKLLSRKLSLSLANLIIWPVCLFYSVILIALFGGWGVLMALGAIPGVVTGVFNLDSKALKMSKKTKADLLSAEQKDSSWNEESLKKYAEDVFLNYQTSWSNNDLQPVKSNLTPEYFTHASLMTEALILAKRKNLVASPKILSLEIVRVNDVEGKEGDSYSVAVNAQAKDELIDSSNDEVLFRDSSSFIEYWNFERRNEVWLLSGVYQATQSAAQANQSLKSFATSNGLFYSADWGWLLLPTRGQLFGKANFGASDINNHVIGNYSGLSGQILIQIYNYIPVKTDKEGSNKNYLVTQAYLPKSYGNILVRQKRKTKLFNKPKNLTQVQMEWDEFNELYEVWATDPELATSFELLNPKFMEVLQQLPFEVNIEVVDNVLYLYSSDKKLISADNYFTMLKVLYEAFKQMKM
jgi:hypothetical protein